MHFAVATLRPRARVLKSVACGQIADSDKIMVVDGGVVVEFDSPQALLARPESVYAKLVRDSTSTA